MPLKTCSECNTEKDTTLFGKNGSGFRSKCKECTNTYNKANNRLYDVPTSGTFRCSRCADEKSFDNFSVNIHCARGRRYSCKMCDTIIKKEIHDANLEESRRKTREQSRKRRENIENRIRLNLGTRLWQVVQKKHGNTMELTGCTKEHLLQHLKSKFTEGMSWENYGQWHIDHIRPCASFNLEDPEEQKKCFHWTNLQPLWAEDNIRKGAKV